MKRCMDLEPRRRTRAALRVVAAAALAVSAPALAAAPAEPPATAAAAPLPPTLEERIVAASERVKPAVVHVEAILRVNDRRREVTGSGFVVSASGHILTNHHVVERAEKVEVSVPGRKRPYPARVLGTDPQTDVALLEITPEAPLAAAELGDARAVRVGQWVLAVGNPYGLDGTVSLGIVSAKGRNLEIPELINDFIQTDAMIDRGSSGGPLVDLEGRVIGVNSRGQGRGIGFTIPIDTAVAVMDQILAGGVERGWLGVAVQPLDRDLADWFGMPDATGVVVNGVTEGSPAAHAGLRAGDVITALDGVAVEAEEEEDLARFQRRVAGIAPGGTASLEVLRGSESLHVEATLGRQPRVEPDEARTELGFHVQEITEGLYREARLATRRGAYVSFVAPGSPAAEAGLQPGDVVERVNRREVADLADFGEAMEAVEAGPRFLVEARRGTDLMFLLIQRGARPAPAAEPSMEAGRSAPGPDDAAGAAPALP